MRFEIYPTNENALASALLGTQSWRWRLRSGNTQIMASGEGYVSKQNVERAIETMKREIATAPVVFVPS